jgi:ketosteroid isomerase-like protein
VKERATKVQHIDYIYKMSRVFLIAVFLFVLGLVKAQTDTAQIRQLMQYQETAWNNGDLLAFMAYYWNDERLKFVGSKGVTYGWKNTLANYQRSYDSKEKMGKLGFTLLSLEQLSGDYIFVTGRWNLQRAQPVGGHFSLLWRKLEGKWVIIADHTS